MNAKFLLFVAMLAFSALHVTPSRADDIKAGDLVISQAWSRATPGGAKVASGYLTITNNGTVPDRLLGGTTDLAGTLTVHEMADVNGVMRMRELDSGLAVPPDATVTLAPAGYHLMLTPLKQPLKQGETVTMTLKFERAGDVAVPFEVLGIGAQGPAAAAGKPAAGRMDHDKMNMDHGKMNNMKM